jgi:hypothetical protein
VLTHQLKFVIRSAFSPATVNLCNVLMPDIGLQDGEMNAMEQPHMYIGVHETRCWMLLHDRRRPSHPLLCMGVASY